MSQGSGSHLFMESSMNFIEQLEHEEYETEPQFLQNFTYNNIQREAQVEQVAEQNIQNETNEEINLEEPSTMKYQEADALIRAEIKEVILKKETEKTTVVVLSEQKNMVIEQIRSLQDLIEDVGQITEKLNVNAEIEKDELQHLQQRLQYNGEILNKLEEFMKTIDDKTKQLKFRSQQILHKFSDQKKDVSDSINDWENEIARLKVNIDNKKSSNFNANTGNPLRQEILLIKSKLLDKRDHLEKLQEQCQQIELKKDNLSILCNEKQKLDLILNDQNQKVQELKALEDQIQKENEERAKDLDLKIEEKRQESTALLQTADELKNKLQQRNEEKNRLSTALASAVERNAQLENKIADLTTMVEDRQKELQENSEKWKQDAQIAEAKLNESQNKVAVINKENNELSCCLEALRQNYVEKIEEKCEKLLLKSELEEKLRIEELLLNKIKLLVEKCSNKKKAILELSEKIENPSTDMELQELEKKKAYLISSTDYLTEKFENVTQQVENVKSDIKLVKQCMDSNNNSILEKQKLYDALLKELQEIEGMEDSDEDQRPPPSILKSPSSHKKIFPASPKKVQFEGVSSYESTTSSDPASVPVQQTILGKSFDEILEEIHAGTFKRPAKPAKKRKVDLE